MFSGVTSGLKAGGKLAGLVVLGLGSEAAVDAGWNERRDWRSAAVVGGVGAMWGSRYCEFLSSLFGWGDVLMVGD